jgi:hypothetical protein
MLHVCWKPELWSQQRQPLLGNGSANTSITRQQRHKQTPVGRQWLSKHHVTAAMLTCAITEELSGTMFSVRSVPKPYNEGVSRPPSSEDLRASHGQWWVSCEIGAVEHGSRWIYGGESRYQATTGEDTADWEDLVRAVVNFRVCELPIAL